MRPAAAAPAVTLALAVLAACAGSSVPPGGRPGASGGGEAAGLYRARCSGCHRPYAPSSRSRAEWRAALARMAPKAHLSHAEEEALRGYLEAGASDATR